MLRLKNFSVTLPSVIVVGLKVESFGEKRVGYGDEFK